MKKSITKRLFITIILITTGFSAMLLLANTLLLKPLYYSSIERSMVSGIEKLSAIDLNSDYDVWSASINAISAGNLYDITIENQGSVLYSSSMQIGLQSRPPSDMEPHEDKQPRKDFDLFMSNIVNSHDIGNGITMSTFTDPKGGTNLMVCRKILDNGYTVYLTQAAEPINKSVKQANILLVGCMVIFFGIAAIISMFISRSFTRPIRSIQEQVGKIAELDFNGKCKIATGDELENLANDVNTLSDKLQTALVTLKEQNIQLEKDIVSQKKFLSNASHELRTPLSLIKGYANEISSGFVTDTAQQKYYIEIISEESAKMNRLLNEILDLSRLESGRMEIAEERLPVNERITAFLEKYDGYISDNNMKITPHFGDEAYGLFDPMRFEQILANYISNAAKYGDINKQVKITTSINQCSIRISVFNAGEPIPEDVFANMWDGFYKASEARTRIEGSYGLGLSVVKAIQTVAGQGYGAYNTEGGVVFWFEVKRA